MAATIVKIIRIEKDGIVVRSGRKCFKVKSFCGAPKELVIEVTMGNMTIYELAEIVSGCFEASSTFAGVRLVTFTFNTIAVKVTSGEALGNPEYVVNKWSKAWNEALGVKDKV